MQKALTTNGPVALVNRAVPPGDVLATHAEIGKSRDNLGYDPRVTLDEGLPRFVDWYRDYHRL